MNLVGDDLKNPCLDYIENIIFGSNSATFKAGSKTYATFEEVKADFLSETLKEVRSWNVTPLHRDLSLSPLHRYTATPLHRYIVLTRRFAPR